MDTLALRSQSVLIRASDNRHLLFDIGRHLRNNGSKDYGSNEATADVDDSLHCVDGVDVTVSSGGHGGETPVECINIVR